MGFSCGIVHWHLGASGNGDAGIRLLGPQEWLLVADTLADFHELLTLLLTNQNCESMVLLPDAWTGSAESPRALQSTLANNEIACSHSLVVESDAALARWQSVAVARQICMNFSGLAISAPVSALQQLPLPIAGQSFAQWMLAWSQCLQLCADYTFSCRPQLASDPNPQALAADLSEQLAQPLSIDKRWQFSTSLTESEWRCWRHNLAALKTLQPAVASWLQALVDVDLSDLQRRQQQLLWREQPLDDTFDARVSNSPSVVLGVGNGQLVNRVLSHSQAPVWLLEPERGLLLAALTAFDWTPFLRQGRLRIVVLELNNGAAASVAALEVIQHLQQLRWGQGLSILETASANLHHDWYQPILQALTQQPKQPVADPERLRSAHIDVTVVNPGCGIFADLERCFKQLGLNSRLFNIPQDTSLAPAEWLQQTQQLRQQPSRLTLFRNRCLLENQVVANRLSKEPWLPGQLLSWWWDQPNVATRIDWRDGCAQLPALAFARQLLPQMPAGSQWLAPAARTEFVQQGVVEQPLQQITFVGQSRIPAIFDHLAVLAEALHVSQPLLARELRKLMQHEENFPRLYRRILNLAPAVSAAIDQVSPGNDNLNYFYHYLWQMLETGLMRVAAVALVSAAELPLRVYGDQDWLSRGVVSAAQFGGVAAPEKLPELYANSAINLNLNFMQVSSTVNPKVLDASACGGLVVTDWRPELELLYPDPQCRPLSFQQLDQLPALLAWLLGNDYQQQRLAIADYTRQQHSMLQRARWIAEYAGL